MIDELTSNNSEFTVDIIAAIGAAKKTPANQEVTPPSRVAA